MSVVVLFFIDKSPQKLRIMSVVLKQRGDLPVSKLVVKPRNLDRMKDRLVHCNGMEILGNVPKVAP